MTPTLTLGITTSPTFVLDGGDWKDCKVIFTIEHLLTMLKRSADDVCTFGSF
jgi:hypothetical protein